MQYCKWLFLVRRLSVGLWHARCSLRCALRINSCGNKEQRGPHYRKELYNLCSGQSFDLGHPQQSAWRWVKWISEVRQIMEGWHCQKVGQNVSQGRGVRIVRTSVCPPTLFSLLLHVNSYSRSFRISEGPSSLKKIRKGRISPYSWSLSLSTTDRFFFPISLFILDFLHAQPTPQMVLVITWWHDKGPHAWEAWIPIHFAFLRVRSLMCLLKIRVPKRHSSASPRC